MTPATGGRGGGDGEGRGKPPADAPEVISVWEWVVGALGLVLVTGALVVMLRESSPPPVPTSLTAGLDSVQRVSTGYVAHVTVRNVGSEPVANVSVEGTLTTGEGEPLKGEVTIDHVPAGASHGIGLLFDEDPAAGAFAVHVKGFTRP